MVTKRQMKSGVLFAFLILSLALTACSSKEKQTGQEAKGTVFVIDERSQDKSEAVKSENPLSGRNVFFAGYVDATLSSTSTVALENLPENEDFLIKYIITDKEKEDVVFETNLIPSGQCVVWVPGDTLAVGTYELQFLAVPYYADGNGEFQQLTSACNDVRYEITE